MILFIHGFGSCGWGDKSLQLRRHFGIRQVLAPDLPFEPRAAIQKLHQLLEDYPVDALVGSSLGGFYATWLNRSAPRPAVLINPVVAPQHLLLDHLGLQHRWCDQAPFEVHRGQLATLAVMQREKLADEERYLVLLQRGDEVLDYRQAAAFYADKDVVESAGGDHRYSDFGAQLPAIAAWLAKQRDGGAPAAFEG